MKRFAILLLLQVSTYSFAGAGLFECENCAKSVMVPIGASNAFVPPYFWLIFLVGFMLACVSYLFEYVKTKKITMKLSKLLTLALCVMLSMGYFASTYFEGGHRQDFAGEYEFRDEKITLKVVDDELIHLEKSEAMESLGSYMRGEKTKLLILHEDSGFYVVDMHNKTVFKLVKMMV